MVSSSRTGNLAMWPAPDSPDLFASLNSTTTYGAFQPITVKTSRATGLHRDGLEGAVRCRGIERCEKVGAVRRRPHGEVPRSARRDHPGRSLFAGRPVRGCADELTVPPRASVRGTRRDLADSRGGR